MLTKQVNAWRKCASCNEQIKPFEKHASWGKTENYCFACEDIGEQNNSELIITSGRCEDFPCCGHEAGCCPDRDQYGEQADMKCTCGASVPLNSVSSICEACLEYRDQLDDYGHDSD